MISILLIVAAVSSHSSPSSSAARLSQRTTSYAKAASECANASFLTSVANKYDVNCWWFCMRGILHCIDPFTTRTPAARTMLHRQEWEASCKDIVRSGKYRPYGASADAPLALHGSLVAVAGLFFGDWLPVLSTAVGGEAGLVYGFEPTKSVRLARATAAANRLPSTHITHACLSNRSSLVRMCIKRSRDPGDSSGGSARIMPTASASSVDDAAVARDRCVQESEVRCATLDEALPWQAHRVGLILLDVEGHEAAALEGAAEVIKKWKPILALERKLGQIMQEIPPTADSPLMEKLPSGGGRRSIFHACALNYQGVASCDGLNFYAATPLESMGQTPMGRAARTWARVHGGCR